MKEKVVKGIGCILAPEEPNLDQNTLVFVHGAGGSHHIWVEQMQYLSKRFNTVAVNLPGHGLGQRGGENTIQGYVEAVRELMHGLGLERVILAGLSMGGAITQTFALAYPERLIGIILFSTGARLRVMPQIFDMILNDYESYLRFLPKFAFAESTPPEIYQPVVEERRNRDPKVVHGDFQACHAFDLMDRVGEINLPCLIFSGAEDKLTPPNYQDYLHEKISGSRLVRFDNAGHILNLERLDDVNKNIEEFVESIKGE
jgi:pimeloyl-ACP methyl ester carboxylesterase